MIRGLVWIDTIERKERKRIDERGKMANIKLKWNQIRVTSWKPEQQWKVFLFFFLSKCLSSSLDSLIPSGAGRQKQNKTESEEIISQLPAAAAAAVATVVVDPSADYFQSCHHFWASSANRKDRRHDRAILEDSFANGLYLLGRKKRKNSISGTRETRSHHWLLFLFHISIWFFFFFIYL